MNTACKLCTANLLGSCFLEEDECRLYVVACGQSAYWPAGCASEGPANEAWPCHMTSPCRGGFERVLYGWGKNAPAMSLPTGVGYGVGPGSAMQSLVLQVCHTTLLHATILLQNTLSALSGAQASASVTYVNSQSCTGPICIPISN